MNYIKKLKFGKLYSSEKIKEDIIKKISKAYRINSRYFNETYLDLKFVICTSEEEWKRESKYYYFPFGVGTVLRDGTFVIKNLDLVENERDDFEEVIVHEMNHVFFAKKFGLTKPVWIQEGMANYVSKQPKPIEKKELLRKIKKENINSKVIAYRYLKRNFSTREKIILTYSIWYHFIDFLNKNQNKRDFLVRFMDEYIKNPSLTNYNMLFKKHFRNSLNKLYLEFLCWLEK